MSSTGPSNGGSNTADERKQKTYSEQLEDIQEKKRKENLKTRTEFGYTKTKTKSINQQNLEDAQRMQRENRGGNQVVQSPSTAEVSQVTATEVTTPEVDTPKEDDITIRKRKAKARGRSPTILTGVTGVTGGLTLGKPSLLGR